MQYFRKTNFDAYSILLVRLGLKDSFIKQVRLIIIWLRIQVVNCKEIAAALPIFMDCFARLCCI